MQTGPHFIPQILVTGATGLIGRWLVPLLSRQGLRVAALMRKPQKRQKNYLEWIQNHGGVSDKVKLYPLDLDQLSPEKWAPELSQVEAIYHLAADFSWGAAREVAYRRNVTAGLELLRWAAQMPQRPRFINVSGYRVAAEEAPGQLTEDSFSHLYKKKGAYEASKVEVHFRLKALAEELKVPLTIVNPSTVSGDSQSGETTQFIGLAQSIEDLYQGRLPALPGGDDVWLPIVPVDYLAEFMARLLDYPETIGGEYWLLDPKTPRLHQLLRKTAHQWQRKAPTATVPLALLYLLPERMTGAIKETLEFLSSDDYPYQEAQALAEKMALPLPDFESAYFRWVNYLVTTNFGQRTLPRSTSASPSVALSGLGELEKPQVVFLHGLPLDSASFAPLLESSPLPAASIDLPGLGHSEVSQGIAKDTLNYLEQAKPEYIVAHSMGCKPAILYAQKHPQQLKALLLIAPYFLQRRAPWYLRTPWLSQQLFRNPTAAKLAKALGLPALAEASALKSATFQLQRPQVRHRLSLALQEASEPQSRQELQKGLAQLSMPVHILAGEQDPILEESKHPTQIVSGAGHYPQLTHPELVREALLRLISQQSEHIPSTRQGQCSSVLDSSRATAAL